MNKAQRQKFTAWLFKIRNAEEGRFVPYIGDYYGRYDKDLRILVIGPRHYCDAIYDSRNFLALPYDRFKQYIDKPIGAEITLTVGCTKDSAAECLKAEIFKLGESGVFRCPVYLRMGDCPLAENRWAKCPFKGLDEKQESKSNLNCDGKRHLRCETIVSIFDYLKDKKDKRTRPKIESKGRGKTYFDEIEIFVKQHLDRYRDANLPNESAWKRICFMNLCQRYIPYRGVGENSKRIFELIDKATDINFCVEVIDRLNPNVIIYTDDCVRLSLFTILKQRGYIDKTKEPTRKSFGYFYHKDWSSVFDGKFEWKIDVANYINEHEYPHDTKSAKRFFKNLIGHISKKYEGLSDVKIRNEALDQIIKVYASELGLRPSLKVKCFRKDMTQQDRYESLRNWITRE